MDLVTWKIHLAFQALLDREEGEDLVEYAIIIALMALGSVAGMSSVGNAINAIFSRLGDVLAIAFR